MPRANNTDESLLSLEIDADKYVMIDLAAKSLGVSVEDFILTAALQAAKE